MINIPAIPLDDLMDPVSLVCMTAVLCLRVQELSVEHKIRRNSLQHGKSIGGSETFAFSIDRGGCYDRR